MLLLPVMIVELHFNHEKYHAKGIQLQRKVTGVLKTTEEVKFTNKSGTTFTVNIVPQQMIKSFCPICLDVTIAANPVCLQNRYHVVCSACAPIIINSESSKCPECNTDGSKASRNYMSQEIKHYIRELNNTGVTCDSCKYRGSFSDIDSHHHGDMPSESPFWVSPSTKNDVLAQKEDLRLQASETNIAAPNPEPNSRNRIVSSLYSQIKDTDFGCHYESFCLKLGLSEADLAGINAEARRQGMFWSRGKLALQKCFSIRDTRPDLPPINLEYCKRALREVGAIELSRSLKWPENS